MFKLYKLFIAVKTKNVSRLLLAIQFVAGAAVNLLTADRS